MSTASTVTVSTVNKVTASTVSTVSTASTVKGSHLLVCRLKFALEKVQGPPGTGKSTTIYHMVTYRLPKGARVLVTCSRNVAVESIAQKLQECTQDKMLVVGNPKRIGDTACNHLLTAKCERHSKVAAITKMAQWLSVADKNLGGAVRSKLAAVQPRSRGWGRAYRAYVRYKWRVPCALARWCSKYSSLCSAMLVTAASSVEVAASHHLAIPQLLHRHRSALLLLLLCSLSASLALAAASPSLCFCLSVSLLLPIHLFVAASVSHCYCLDVLTTAVSCLLWLFCLLRLFLAYSGCVLEGSNGRGTSVVMHYCIHKQAPSRMGREVHRSTDYPHSYRR